MLSFVTAVRYGLLLIAGACLMMAHTAAGQREPAPLSAGRSSVTTKPHFFAAHGRGGMIDGDSSGGLEVWIYPFQILRDYTVGFRHAGESSEIPGSQVLSRVEYDVDGIVRVFIGTDFVVRERLFAPEQTRGAVISYQVDSRSTLEITVHATPILDLMWPGALGGQGVGWNDAVKGFVLSEPLYGYTAVVKSPGTVAHDTIVNEASANEQEIGFSIRPDRDGKASVYVALNPAHAADEGAPVAEVIRNFEQRKEESAAKIVDFQKNTLLLKTPDEEVNWAFARAETALDQAWVCNADIGCGFVAGYGPTRPHRRPQYDWFFAGDGMIAEEGALAVGDLSQARDELELVIRWQNKKSGMIWHELSQSASFVDWANKYPYMFVHVDITFQFLAAVREYVRVSGDVEFLKKHWSSIESAYRYCRGLIDPATQLPRIPEEKEGGNEQGRLSDDLGLSTSWVEAADAMADMAGLTGHKELADDAARSEQTARKAIPDRYWSDHEGYWIDGHNGTGKAILEHRSGPAEAILLNLFGPTHGDAILDQLASSAFQTDWGTRSVGSESVGYDPDSYASGSVWPVNTARLSEMFWTEHRPVTALSVWQTLIPLSSVDSPGHIDEVFSGASFHPQAESVPEQTWSSAGFASATVHGLLGLEVEGVKDQLTFTPRTPAQWSDVEIEHIRMPKQCVSLKLHKGDQHIELKVENTGDPFVLNFQPDLPLGSKLVRSTFAGRQIRADLEQMQEETLARIAVTVPAGSNTLDLIYSDGISIIVDPVRPILGNGSTGIHVVHAALEGRRLLIDADVPADRVSQLRLVSPWSLSNATGAMLEQMGAKRAQLRFSAEHGNDMGYRRAHVEIEVSAR